tara:strand:- start:272 stop:451 length:180 start_codon:yes stop_codon:yes gene_type:complete
MKKTVTIDKDRVRMLLVPESEIENELFIRFNSREPAYVKLKETDNTYYNNRIQLNFTIR